ncbi:MAG: hypothetical protein WCQ64_07750, partial [Acidobacteriota bacterium]
MGEPTNPADRLDSWKAIGEYLGRDVRTLQRWESQGLPVRRVAGGGRGSSVFAYKSEIDAWLRGGGGTDPTPAQPEPAALRDPAVSPHSVAPRRWPYAVAALTLIAAAAAWLWFFLTPRATARVIETAEAVIAMSADGSERWRFAFPADEVTVLPDVPPVIMLDGPAPGALATTAVSARRSDGLASSGVVRWFGLNSSTPIRAFAFDDRRTFAGRVFAEPWTIADVELRKAPGPRRIAVAARHNNHWPGLVTILDDRFERHGTFVNSGWVLSVRWLGADRLVLSGFNEAKDGGMLAVLDAAEIDGASPEAPGAEFACDGCGAARPLFYA